MAHDHGLERGDPMTTLQATTGPTWAQHLTAVDTAIIALGIVGTAVGVFLARRQLVEAKEFRHSSCAVDLARRWDDNALISVGQSLEDVPPEHFEVIYQSSTDRTPLTFANGGFSRSLLRALWTSPFGSCCRGSCVDARRGCAGWHGAQRR